MNDPHDMRNTPWSRLGGGYARSEPDYTSTPPSSRGEIELGSLEQIAEQIARDENVKRHEEKPKLP